MNMAPPAPDGPMLVDQLRFMASRHPDDIAYEDLDTGTSLTFAQWDAQSNQLARWLLDQNVAPQDRVALYMDSDHCLQWITTYAAIHKTGAVMVPVNTRLSVDEVGTILGHAEPRVIVTNDRLRENAAVIEDAQPIAATLATSEWKVLDGYDAGFVQVPTDADDMADIMYTSGTTGLPKSVLVRHRNVAMMPNLAPQWTVRGWLHGAPLFTFAGMSFIYNPMKLGLKGLYMPRFDVEQWFDVVEREQPTMIFLVPAIAELLTASPRFDGADLHGPTALSIGSTALAPVKSKNLQDKMPQATVMNSY